MNFLGFGNSASFVLKFTSAIRGRPTKKIKHEDGGVEELVIFQGHEPIQGEVTVIPKGKKLEHVGIKVELIGQIEMLHDPSRNSEFTSLVSELDSPGLLYNEKTYGFNFANVPKQYESYRGLNVRLRYFLRVTVTKPYGTSTKEHEFWVQNVQPEPEINNSIKMEVGIEECLHIEFEYQKSKYHPNEAVVGKIYFMLVRIKIKYMELGIMRRESTGTGDNMVTDSDKLTKFEIMDGCPVRGEAIPVRLFLSDSNLTPTYENVNNQFSVRYFLNLVLVDQEERSYFKQQEITVWRKDLG
ncbi:Vacuolar protein sorting-associated protein 26 [Hondaea fermentalgiana]|uniref:Vacuolar protein sorting-associated protein 26 n=1 Tax=Hondaea fermentalgiana TaxID=2315210 RepID=A0A2R5FZN4_9STRA|nr:Vacuolar protein sorting-associated protein 26 [Hondaea fermentalgiana]|eukprot:GBG24222.1 Vacuolar protein sorting-associated protein 26 [Hondaea fermentalgiana]